MKLLAQNTLLPLTLAVGSAGLVAALSAPSFAQATPPVAENRPENPAGADNTMPGTTKSGEEPVKNNEENDGPNATMIQAFEVPETLQVGERIELKLTVEHPEDTRVHLPEALPNPRWELSDSKQETRQVEGKQTTELTLTLQIFRPGETTLGAFEIMVLAADGRVTKLETDPVKAKVVSVLTPGEEPELKPAQKPVAVWTVDYTPLWVGGGLGAALLLGAAGFFIARRRRPEAPPPPPRPAHIVALEKLSALTDGALLQSGEYMLYYVRLSEAIREYLGRRYQFRGTELTTTEILQQLARVDSGEGWPKGLSFEDVRDWLNHCDIIKFSDAVPAREESDLALRRAFTIVELTREKEASTQEKEDGSQDEKETLKTEKEPSQTGKDPSQIDEEASQTEEASAEKVEESMNSAEKYAQNEKIEQKSAENPEKTEDIVQTSDFSSSQDEQSSAEKSVDQQGAASQIGRNDDQEAPQ